MVGGRGVNLFGIPVVVNPLAVEHRVWFTVERWPIPKRRRRWRVVRHEETKPAMFIVGENIFGRKTAVLHPELFAKITGL
jgi:hypothetical protein